MYIFLIYFIYLFSFLYFQIFYTLQWPICIFERFIHFYTLQWLRSCSRLSTPVPLEYWLTSWLPAGWLLAGQDGRFFVAGRLCGQPSCDFRRWSWHSSRTIFEKIVQWDWSRDLETLKNTKKHRSDQSYILLPRSCLTCYAKTKILLQHKYVHTPIEFETLAKPGGALQSDTIRSHPEEAQTEHIQLTTL